MQIDLEAKEASASAALEPREGAQDQGSSSVPARRSVQVAKIAWVTEYCLANPGESIIVFSNGASDLIASRLSQAGVRAKALRSACSGIVRGNLLKAFEDKKI